MVEEETITLDSSSGATTAKRPTEPAAGELSPGSCVDRYTIVARLGSGGMGEVYSAHDPDLDRRVAIKVVRPRLSSPDARLRLKREAQALARLNHPNVAGVYDVGVLDDSTFIAMELVEGVTLATWLAERTRDPRTVVEVFLQAGRGLAAAHAAGIVHRDFKPSNVMVGDRVRVVDFGLARPADDEVIDTGEAASVLDATVTSSDVVVGTPAYMAPEQRALGVASPLSDEYSFALTLHEALTGRRPTSAAAIGAVPSWLKPVLERALNDQPDQRFPSMDALLAALARNPYRARRRWLIAAGVLTSFVGIGALAFPRSSSASCDGAEAELAGVWDAERSARLRAAFGATHLANAEVTWQRVSGELDAYRGKWLAMHTAACRATRIDGHQSEVVMVRRMDCLERRRSLVRELTQVWLSGSDAKTLRTAHDAVTSLPSIAECGETRALAEQAPLPGDPAIVAKIATTRTEIDRVRALLLAGRLEQAQQKIPAILADADATGWPQVRAEARYLAGSVHTDLVMPTAEGEMLEASQLAAAAHDDRLAAQALVQLVHHLAMTENSAERALLTANIAEGALARIGPDERLRAKLQEFRGEALETAGKLPEAREAFTRAHAIAAKALGDRSDAALIGLYKLASIERSLGNNVESLRLGEQALPLLSEHYGPQHPRVAAVLNELGAAAYNLSNYDRAAGYLARSLEIVEASSGPDSANMAIALTSAGSNAIRRGRLDEARTMLERAAAIRERMLGPDHPRLAEAIQSLATVFQLQGEYDRALELVQRQRTIQVKAYGATDPRVAGPISVMADIARERGHLAEALRGHREALEICSKGLGAEHPRTLEQAVTVASTLSELHRCGEARPLLDAAIPAIEKAGADTSNALEVRATCELAEGRATQAASSAANAVAVCAKANEAGLECASKYWILARALDAAGKRREAIAAATQAEQRIAKSDSTLSASDVSALRAWLAARR